MANTNKIPDLAAVDFMGAREPFALFEAWFKDATAHEINDPNAMSLATVDPSGLPNVRVVLLKGLDGVERGSDRGFVFYTNREGAKGRELIASKKAAVGFHWKSLRRQVRVRGTVATVSDAEADAYYRTRPRGSRLGAWASDQSRALDARETLEARVAALEKKYSTEDIPRPPHWTGFRITPLEIEFWHDRPFRLHDRLVFRRAATTEAWTTARLYP
jgi:pyridoxamine 5'-phosphate oxidase